jgi:hypothetical protein
MMFTAVGTSRRSTTARRGTEAGQSWVDQTRSAPEVIFSASEEGETSHVQAGVARLVSLTVSTTGLTAKARPVTEGTATTSLLGHGPVGCASALADLPPRPVAVGVGPVSAPSDRPVGAPVGAVAPVGGVDPVGTDGVGDPDVADMDAGVDSSAPTGCADGPLAGLPPPTRWAIPNTSSSANPSRSSRRVQYTRGGSGPLGRVTAVMVLTVCGPAAQPRLPHRGGPGSRRR